MSATNVKQQQQHHGMLKTSHDHNVGADSDSAKQVKPAHQINPSYTVRVLCCVLFIFLTELCLAHYIYRLINAEISQNYVDKNDFRRYFISELRSGASRQEILDVVREFDRNVKEGLSHGGGSSARRKRGALVLDDNALNSPSDGPNVEFFNPKLKHDLEAKDAAEKQRTGHKGAAPGGDSWVWLTSYSRIPLDAIEGFCRAARDYCPPGKQGVPGTAGSKGDRGDPGFPGIPGPIGPRGHPGLPGERGVPGRQGLDGRDGVPGEPGLDGVPGRSGLDGLPGEDGKHGKDGLPGRDGRNGTDGRPGLTGPTGPPGPQGPRGMHGPRGGTGKPGTNGIPGIPGIQAWTTKDNRTDEILIKPSIAGATLKTPRGPIVVNEGDRVRLRCGATGNPTPQIEWRRLDNLPISMGSWQATSVPGHTLNITKVTRVHMGHYQCIAYNGIPPQASKTFHLEVHFAPMIKIRNQMVGAANGSTATLVCEVEAFPESVRYWERSDGRLLEDGDKYKIDNSLEKDGYKAIMQMNITRLNHHDFVSYHCISKNDIGLTKGVFTLHEIDPKLATPPSVVNGGTAVFGSAPPKKEDLDDICPPVPICAACPEIKDFKCHDSGISLFDLVRRLQIRPFGNSTYPGLPNRSSDCVLYAVGKPVYLRFTEQQNSSWMRDSLPPTEAASEKFWVTRDNDSYHLLEYGNKALFRKDTPTRTYSLEHPFKGNSHVVYNGSFYYHKRDFPTILKLDLATERYHGLNVSMIVTNGSNYLYQTDYNYMDFNIDDNGLWVIYGLPVTNNTVVLKIDSNTMQIQYAWNISINHHNFGEMFIVCGVLYGVDSVTEIDSRIRLALDLYKNHLLDVNLVFTNPFRKTTMVGYNHRNKELYTCDKGNQLTYPVRYHEIGYNYTKGDKQEHGDGAMALMQTGYDITKNEQNTTKL